MASSASGLPLGSFSKQAADGLLAGDYILHNLVTSLSINGSLPGRRLITYAGGALAIVLSAPVAGQDDGKLIEVLSTSAFAHTVTCTGHLIDGNGHSNTMTLGAHAGAGFIIEAYQGNWYVRSANFATGS